MSLSSLVSSQQAWLFVGLLFWQSGFAFVASLGTHLLHWSWDSLFASLFFALSQIPLSCALWRLVADAWRRPSRQSPPKLLNVVLPVVRQVIYAMATCTTGALAGAAASAHPRAGAAACLLWFYRRRAHLSCAHVPVVNVSRWRHVKALLPSAAREALVCALAVGAASTFLGRGPFRSTFTALIVVLCADIGRVLAYVVRLEPHRLDVSTSDDDRMKPFVSTPLAAALSSEPAVGDGAAAIARILAYRDFATKCEQSLSWRSSNVFTRGSWDPACAAAMCAPRALAKQLKESPSRQPGACDAVAASYGARAAASLCRASLREDVLGLAQLSKDESVALVMKQLREMLALVAQAQRVVKSETTGSSPQLDSLADELTLAVGTILEAFRGCDLSL